jgi:hypothetical protein
MKKYFKKIFDYFIAKTNIKIIKLFNINNLKPKIIKLE